MNSRLPIYCERVDRTLKNAIVSVNNTSLLHEALLYSTQGGGKRLRPALVYATGECFGQTHDALDAIAAAVECIHCYSLIHDDLPAMDDDKLRRGKATVHIVFGESIAILAGDALQTLAFDLLSKQQSFISMQAQLHIIRTLAHYAGSAGMIGGQSLDILAEGKKIDIRELQKIHDLKTGALIRASVKMGALGAGCDNQQSLNVLDQFAARLGFAFQLQDDLLDVIGNSKNLGKNTGQDVKHEKATYAILFGIKPTKQRIKILMDEAIELLKSLPEDTTSLKQLCECLMNREV